MSRDDDSRRDLERIEREREKLLSGPEPGPGAEDDIERLGRRIAGILGPLIAVALTVYLYMTYLH